MSKQILQRSQRPRHRSPQLIAVNHLGWRRLMIEALPQPKHLVIVGSVKPLRRFYKMTQPEV